MGDFRGSKYRGNLLLSLGRHLICVALMGLALGGVGCGKGNKKNTLIKDCRLPDDQSATLSGRWLGMPVPLAVKAGAFGPDETRAVTNAATSWNKFTEASMGFLAFGFGDASNPTQSNANKPSSLCAQAILREHDFTGNVVLYKHSQWPYKSKGVIALTSFCPRPANPFPRIYMAIMELNYQDFFVEGKPVPDLQSIMLHEFGHLLGLNHSCESTKKAGFPDCRDPELPQPYFSASLFPIFSFNESGLGEKRLALGENDQGRTNCLYQDLFKP